MSDTPKKFPWSDCLDNNPTEYAQQQVGGAGADISFTPWQEGGRATLAIMHPAWAGSGKPPGLRRRLRAAAPRLSRYAQWSMCDRFVAGR